MAKTRVLLIDDEVNLCRMIKLNLERLGDYDVTVAFSGPDGLDKFRAAAFDVVITDFNMPGMTGGDVLQTIKQARPNLPVILASVYHDDPKTMAPGSDRRADRLISKPFNHLELEGAIREVLGRGAAAPAGAAGSVEGVQPGKGTGMAKKRILIIDDEEDFGRLLKLNIEKTGEYEALLATNGGDGVALVKVQRPDLVLLDIMMPGMDGLATLTQIKAVAPELPVAMVTACWNEEEARRIMAAGAYEYITKPVDFSYLKTALLVKLFS